VNLQKLLLPLAVAFVVTPACMAQAQAASKPAVEAKPKSVALAPGPATLQATSMATAIDTFNKGDFHAALKQFEPLSTSGKQTDLAHYYMAQCYQHTSQVAAAVQNYKIVLATSKDQTLRYYSAAACSQLNSYSKHRTYQGNGNVFVQNRGRGGGGHHHH
jgi:Tfp pilus assembly protein PilF